MKRSAGLLALLTVLFTGMHFVTGPSASRGSAEVKAAETSQPPVRRIARSDSVCQAFASSASAAGSSEAAPTSSNNGEIAALFDRFLNGGRTASNSETLPEGIRILIATVPDPVHTHLSLQFDRTLEAIQQAAQDERYTYDSSWLPWRTRGPDPSAGASDREAETREAAGRETCPGVILFRKTMSSAHSHECRINATTVAQTADAPYFCGMIVFIVGERPTSGLDQVQWNNAVGWIDSHASKTRPDRTLRVLGPTFSGSMPSFVRALQNANRYSNSFTSTLLYSGRIRGCASWHWFQSELNPPVAPGVASLMPVRIADFEENDAVQSDHFYRFLKDRGHSLSEIAILSEDETAYGGLPDSHPLVPDAATQLGEPASPCNPEYPPGDRPVHLYYPRDISAIRSAYQEQSIFSGSSKSDSASSQPHTVLRPDYDAAAHSDTDTVEPFSGTNLALTQEAQLYGVVNTLRVHGIRFVILRSTNSLDYLFLTRFLHRAYPTAYIITMGTDLLFAREVDSTEFRGVAALSSFPLLPRGQDWTRQLDTVPQHAHRVFGSYTMEGCYLAARFLFTDPPATAEEVRSGKPYHHPAKADIPDFAMPFWEDPSGSGATSQSATWLSVIGREGYWPLAVLRKGSINPPRFSNLAIVDKPSAEMRARIPDPPSPERLSLSSTWRFCCVLALLLLMAHIFACKSAWKHPNLGMFVQFTPLEGQRSAALVSAGWAILISLHLTLCLVSLRIYPWLGTMDRAWVWLTGLAALVGCVLTFFELRWWYEPVEEPPSDPFDKELRETRRLDRAHLYFSPLWLTLLFAVVACFAAALLLSMDYGDSNDSGVTTAYRSIHLSSGVSPIISILAMLAGFYWWFWQSLAGLALLGNGRPVLPRSRKISLGLAQVSDRLADNIDHTAVPFPSLTRSTLLLYLLPAFLVVLLAFVLQRAWTQAFDLVLHSLENQAFNTTLHVLIAIALYLVLLEAGQFYFTWLALKRLLLALNRLPLRRTFAGLQGLSMHSLWNLSGTSSRARYKVFAHQLESLLHLRNELESFAWRDCGTPALRHTVRATWAQGWHFVQERSKGPDLAMINDVEAYSIRVHFSACAESVFNDLLVPEWSNEGESLDLSDPVGEGEAREHLRLSGRIPVRLGEEFLCMTYIGYLQNLLGRMRTMVLSMVGIFAAIAIAVGFYPYTPRPTISLCLLALLLLIGAVVGTVYAGLDRDSTLSHITNTQPGALGAHFWIRMVSFVGVPALGLIVAQFPEVADFVFSWLEPTINAVK